MPKKTTKRTTKKRSPNPLSKRQWAYIGAGAAVLGALGVLGARWHRKQNPPRTLSGVHDGVQWRAHLNPMWDPAFPDDPENPPVYDVFAKPAGAPAWLPVAEYADRGDVKTLVKAWVENYSRDEEGAEANPRRPVSRRAGDFAVPAGAQPLNCYHSMGQVCCRFGDGTYKCVPMKPV